SGHVGANRDQVTVLLIGSPGATHGAGAILVIGAGDCNRDPRDRLFDVDRREMPGFGETPGQDEMAVEERARRLADRIAGILAFGEDGIERRDRAAAMRAVAAALDELWQAGEHRRWVALGRRRLADRQGNLARGHGEARE